VRTILTVVVVLAGWGCAHGQAPKGYDDGVVLVASGRMMGSGVAVHRGDQEFVWTAAHVVAGAERVREVVDPQTGETRFEVSYSDVRVMREVKADGCKAGEDVRIAEILRFSDPEGGYDLALLRSRAPVAKTGVGFADKSPGVGQAVYHVGSPGGLPGYNSYIPGTIAARGRPSNWSETEPSVRMDQYSLPITGGSSGGPVFDARTWKVVGLVVQANPRQPTISFGVPVEAVRRFAKESHCEWAVDPAVPVPAGTGYHAANPRSSPLPVPK
jgi:S1-C subfamily serine protease